MRTKRWPYITTGIPDELFFRGEVPMTKAEIRCLTLSRLRLEAHHRLLDVGAGTGSIAVECALLLSKGLVLAVEKDQKAVELIRENARLFGVDNLEIVRGAAPEALEALEMVDRIVIGGTGGRLPEILEVCSRKLVPGGILVANCLLLESLASFLSQLLKLSFVAPQVLSVNLARGSSLGGQTMLRPLNPVFIVSAEKEKGGRSWPEVPFTE